MCWRIVGGHGNYITYSWYEILISRLTSKIFLSNIIFSEISPKCTVIKIIISWFENISCRSVRICTSVSSIPGARRSAPLTYCSHHSLYTRFFLSSYSTTPFHFISSNQSNVLFSYSNIPLISRFDIFHGSIEKWITMLGNWHCAIQLRTEGEINHLKRGNREPDWEEDDKWLQVIEKKWRNQWELQVRKYDTL